MFTIKPELLVRMTEVVSAGKPEPGRTPSVRLRASRGRLYLECNGARAESNVLVWDDGQCRVEAGRLLAVGKRFQLEPAVTVDVSGGFLRIRSAAVPVMACSAWTAAAEAGQNDFATD